MVHWFLNHAGVGFDESLGVLIRVVMISYHAAIVIDKRVALFRRPWPLKDRIGFNQLLLQGRFLLKQ